MIVQCPSCAARYRINDENIPSSGGKIRCPTCAHAFVVYPEAESSLDQTSVANERELSKLVSSTGPLELPDEDSDSAPTEMVQSETIEKIRALQELEKEFGDALAGDGTVEMQNPMKIWTDAQKAQAMAQAAEPDFAATVEGPSLLAALAKPAQIVEQADVYDDAATEIVSAATIDLQNLNLNSNLSPFVDEDDPDADPTEIVNVSDVMRELEQDNAATQDLSINVLTSAPVIPQQPFPSDAPPAHPQIPAPYGEKPTNQWGAVNTPDPPNVASGPQLGQDPNYAGPWSLKTNFGLTYEFPDTKSLNNWLQSRDDVQGYSLSSDRTNFHPLTSYPQVMTRNAGASGSFNLNIPSTGPLADALRDQAEFPSQNDPFPRPEGQQQFAPQPGFDGPQVGLGAPSTGALVSNEFVLPSRDGSQFVKVMWAVCLISGIIMCLAAVQVFVHDIVGSFRVEVLGHPQEVVAPVQPKAELKPSTITPVDDEPVVDPEVEIARIKQIIRDAKRELGDNRPKSALEKLEKVIALHPDRAEAYELMAEAHTKLGDEDKADEARQKAERLTTVSP